MIKNYLLIAVRSLRKTAVFTFINIFGLALEWPRSCSSYIMFATSIVMKTFIKRRMAFIASRSTSTMVRVFRTDCESTRQWGHLVKREMPEVVDFVRMFSVMARMKSKSEQKKLSQKNYISLIRLFNVFSIDLLHGERNGRWLGPNQWSSVHQRQRMFGKENAIGQTLDLERTPYESPG